MQDHFSMNDLVGCLPWVGTASGPDVVDAGESFGNHGFFEDKKVVSVDLLLPLVLFFVPFLRYPLLQIGAIKHFSKHLLKILVKIQIVLPVHLDALSLQVRKAFHLLFTKAVHVDPSL